MGLYRRVLLTEDDPLVLLTLTLAFQAEGLEVLGAGSAREAVQALRDETGGIQGAVIDLDLKGGDAHALARACRAVNAEMVVVYLAAAARLGFDREAIAGALIEAKPVNAQVLARQIRERIDALSRRGN